MANNLGLDPFPEPVGHFGAPWQPFWISRPLIGRNTKWPPGGPKMATGVIGHFESLSQNKSFDPSTPSMRKGVDGEEKKTGGKKKENKDVFSGH